MQVNKTGIGILDVWLLEKASEHNNNQFACLVNQWFCYIRIAIAFSWGAVVNTGEIVDV